jgi:hypothetical protein
MKADTAACDIIVEVTLRMLLLSRFAAVFVASHKKNTISDVNMQEGGDASAKRPLAFGPKNWGSDCRRLLRSGTSP